MQYIIILWKKFGGKRSGGWKPQSYHSNLNRASYFKLGIGKLQEEAEYRHETSFTKLDDKQQGSSLNYYILEH